jgi:hypothetical protein
MSREEEMVREALVAHVADVEVEPYALAEIRQRIAARRRRFVPAFGIAGLSAATVLAVVVGVVSCGPDFGRNHTPIGTSSSVPVASSTSHPSTPSGVQIRVPVYYTGNGKLVREYHVQQVPADTVDGSVVAALSDMLRAGSAADPDYATAWPAGVSVRGATYADQVVTVDLSGVPASPPSAPHLALQQLVWTASAAGADAAHVEVTGVRLLVDGKARSTLWGSGTSGVLHRDAFPEIVAPLWVIDPQEGVAVGKTFTVRVAGVVFEGAARLRIRDANGKAVVDQPLQLSVGSPLQGNATVTVKDLPSGRYTVEAFFVSVKDSSEQGLDDHHFTVS